MEQGPLLGRSIAVRVSGARGHKRPGLAIDAQEREKREKFRRVFAEASKTTLNAKGKGMGSPIVRDRAIE